MITLSNPRAVSRGLSFLFLSVFLVTGCARNKEPWVIGHLAPRSGPDQAAGRREGAAMEMGVTETNVSAETQIDGRPVTVIFGDAGADLEGFAPQGTRLLTVNKVVALIGATNAAQLEKLAPAVPPNLAALFTPSGGLAGGENKSVFAVGLDPRERGRWLAKFAAEERKVADILIVMDEGHEIFRVLADAFEREFKHVDRKIRQKWTFRDRKELADLAARVAKEKPPAVLYCGTADGLLSLRRGGVCVDIPVFFGGEEEEAALLRDGEFGRNVYLTTAFTTQDITARKVQDFSDRFGTRSGQTADANAALTYDAAMILFTAARRAKKFRLVEKELKDQLTPQAEFECLTGPFWFTASQTARRTVYVVQVNVGASKLMKSYLPEKP